VAERSPAAVTSDQRTVANEEAGWDFKRSTNAIVESVALFVDSRSRTSKSRPPKCTGA
jgi:hypothetical protein